MKNNSVIASRKVKDAALGAWVAAVAVVGLFAQLSPAQVPRHSSPPKAQTTAKSTGAGLTKKEPAATDDATKIEAVVTTSVGVIRFGFFPDKAPIHVRAFIKLAREGYYDGSAFFRMYSRALIQGGDPLLKNPSTPRGRWGSGGLKQIPDEPSDLKHIRGTVSTVAIPGEANSGGSQFFVCDSDQPQLDGKFSAFGQVTEGMDVVERISETPVDSGQLAEEPVRIVSIKIEPKPLAPFLNATLDEMRRQVVLATDLGDITIQLQPELAPETVRNFLTLVKTGWYDGTAFHRVIPGFVIQGGMEDSRAGGVTSNPADRWVHSLKPEFTTAVKHERGIVSMARSEAPDSATTSFFICLGPAPNLDGGYAIFGKVVEGLDVLDKFEKVQLDGETPVRRIALTRAYIK